MIEATPTVEFYPVESTRGTALAKSLAAAHPTARVVYDPASQAVIVSGGGSLQRAAFETWLAGGKP